MRKARRLSRGIGRASCVFAAKLLLSLTAIVFAASISVTSTTYQAEIGSVINVRNDLIATDRGFSGNAAASAATSCSSPVTFAASPGIANTAITGGDIVYDVQVNSTSGVAPSTNFNATLVLASISYGPVCIRTPASPANGQTIDCKFDVGSVLPSSPYAFKVTIQ